MELANEPVLQAVAAHVRAHAMFGVQLFTVTTDPDTYSSGLIIVEPVTTPVAESLSWDGGFDRAETIVQVTVVAPTYEMARLAGDEVRKVLAGKIGRTHLYPLTVSGHTVNAVTSNGDGFADNDGATSQWAERFTIAYQ